MGILILRISLVSIRLKSNTSKVIISGNAKLAATYIMMGREKEARAEAAEILRINPKFSVDSYAKGFVGYTDQSERDKYINTLRKAGLK